MEQSSSGEYVILLANKFLALLRNPKLSYNAYSSLPLGNVIN
jgi:hypothetical protein